MCNFFLDMFYAINKIINFKFINIIICNIADSQLFKSDVLYQDGININMASADSFLGSIRITGVTNKWTTVMMGDFAVGYISLIEIAKSKKIHFGYISIFHFSTNTFLL